MLADVFPAAECAALHAKVKAYLTDARFRGWETRLTRTPVVSATRVLAPWEVHLLRSRLHLKDEAAPAHDLALAQALAPQPPPPALQVEVAQQGGADLAALAKAHPDAPEVLVAAWEAGVKLKPADFDAALARHGTDAALLCAAASAAVAAQDVARTEALATRGLALAPWSARLSMTLVSVALAKGASDDAARRFDVTVALGPERPSAQTTETYDRVREAIAACRTRAARGAR